ncbi:MAG: glycosyltransferase family 9 protein [Crocinitomicaceae bacterium]
MNNRLLIIIDWLTKPFYVILNSLKFSRKKDSSSNSFVVLKFFGIGSLTRIATVMNQTGVKKTDTTFITLQKNKPIIDLLGLEAKYIKSRNPFSFISSTMKTIVGVWKMKNCTILDMERASNLSGVFRLIVSIGKHCVSFNFNSKSRSFRNQKFISLNNRRATNAIAEMFGKTSTNNLVIHLPNTNRNGVIININAGDYLPQRKFTVHEYVQMIKNLYILHPHWQFELSGLKSELSIVESFKADLIEHDIPSHKITIIAGQHSLKSFADRLKSAALLITNDSGPLHLAYYLGIKTVGIWGPTSPKLVGYENSEIMLNLAADISCSPCFLHPKSSVAKACNGEMTCFKSMIPEEMASKISRFVETTA